LTPINFLSELKTASDPKTLPIRVTDYITVFVASVLSTEGPSKANPEASVKILPKKCYGNELRG